MSLDGCVFVAWFGFKKDNSRKLPKGSCTIRKLCKQKVAHGRGITNLKNHLQMKHRLTYDELFVRACWLLRVQGEYINCRGSHGSTTLRKSSCTTVMGQNVAYSYKVGALKDCSHYTFKFSDLSLVC